MYCRPIFVFLFAICFTIAQGQQTFPLQLRMHSSHTSFPDTARKNGHLYDSVLYDAAEHYMDSSILMIVPPDFTANDQIDLIFWFHGWRNNIDSALIRYHLTSQFVASRRNAMLVLAETAKNSPDSYGGKLEQKDVFDELVDDVINNLRKEKVIPPKSGAGHIVLAGHSGAYRVIARILQNGGAKVSGVALYDAMYGEADLYDSWIQSNISNRFFNLYTNEGGGTDEESIKMMSRLKREDISNVLFEESAVTLQAIRQNRIVFVHSTRAHNDIIFSPDYFRLVLEATPFLTPMP